MSDIVATIKVFKPDSRKIERTFRGVNPTDVTNKLAESLSNSAGRQASKAITAMRGSGITKSEIEYNDRRIRISIPKHLLRA